MITKVFGILNITPDSFSDGGKYLEHTSAVGRGEELIAQGADVIDIGADSTRPNSSCVGKEEEWRRLESVILALSHTASLSIDTHHADVAERALRGGAKVINDISAGADPEMFKVVKEYDAEIVLMYSRCPAPHIYPPVESSLEMEDVIRFLERRIERALKEGISEERIIVDPGMGAFVGTARDSWNILSNLNQLDAFGLPILLGVSRKGFLKARDKDLPADRDEASSVTALLASLSCRSPLYVRTHNVVMMRHFLSCLS